METRVLYKAIADFSTLRREVQKTKRELNDLRRAEAQFNAAQARRSGGVTTSTSRTSPQARITRDLTKALREQEVQARNTRTAIRQHASALIADAAAARQVFLQGLGQHRRRRAGCGGKAGLPTRDRRWDRVRRHGEPVLTSRRNDRSGIGIAM